MCEARRPKAHRSNRPEIPGPVFGRCLQMATIVLACGAAVGCQATSDLGTVQLTDRGTASRGKPEAIRVDAFRADEPRPNASRSGPHAQPGLAIRTAEQADQGIASVEAVVGGPEAARPPVQTSAGAAVSSAREILVDQVVGQINGEPIYAAAFFEPMDARLRAEASRVDSERQAREFIRNMVTEIARQLNDQMRNQLLIDEFQASLSAEERVGIAALIERIRTDLQRGALGSRELADRQLLETEGRGLDAQARYLSDEVFIREHLNRTITKRISVSSRDVQQEYQRRWVEFNPPPIARLRVIRVAENTSQQVIDALNTGRSFTEVAAEFSRWRPDSGNLIEVTLSQGSVREAEFFGVPELNDPAQALSVGQTAGPIRLDSTVWWLKLDEIHQPPSIPLYEAQLQIEEDIRVARFEEERKRYFEGLLERSNFSDREEMVAKLAAFGAMRYLGIQIADAPLPGQSQTGSRLP